MRRLRRIKVYYVLWAEAIILLWMSLLSLGSWFSMLFSITAMIAAVTGLIVVWKEQDR